MRVVSHRKNIIDITIGVLSVISLLINYIEVCFILSDIFAVL